MRPRSRKGQRRLGVRVAWFVTREIRRVRHVRFERALSAITAVGAVIIAGEIFFEHDKVSFGNRWMWSPIFVGTGRHHGSRRPIMIDTLTIEPGGRCR